MEFKKKSCKDCLQAVMILLKCQWALRLWMKMDRFLLHLPAFPTDPPVAVMPYQNIGLEGGEGTETLVPTTWPSMIMFCFFFIYFLLCLSCLS